MTTNARTGIGATISLTSSSPQVLLIGEVQNISGPEESAEEIDATTLDSSSGYKDIIPGLKDGGSITLPILWRNTAAQRTIRNLFGATAASTFSIMLPTSPQTTITFSGRVMNRKFDANPNDPMKMELKLKITGAVTYAP